MTEENLSYFKTLLLEKRDEIINEISQSEELDSRDNLGKSYHIADNGTDTMEMEKKYYFASFEGKLLQAIDSALRRIEDNTYGKCLSCNQEINNERLQAIPHALKCIECKAQEETGGSW